MDRMVLSIRRPSDVIMVVILPHAESGLFSFVNLTKGHICPCKFKSIEDALADLDDYIERGLVLSYEKITTGP